MSEGWDVPAGPEWFPDASKDDAIPPADIENGKDAPTVDITRWHYIDVEEAGPDFDFMGMSIQEDGEWVKYADAIEAQSTALTAATERAERAEAELADEKRKRGEEKAKILRQRESLRGCHKSIQVLTAERNGQMRRANKAEARAERLQADVFELKVTQPILAAIAADTPTQEADHD